MPKQKPPVFAPEAIKMGNTNKEQKEDSSYPEKGA